MCSFSVIVLIGLCLFAGGGSPVKHHPDVKWVIEPALCGLFYELIAVTLIAMWAINYVVE